MKAKTTLELLSSPGRAGLRTIWLKLVRVVLMSGALSVTASIVAVGQINAPKQSLTITANVMGRRYCANTPSMTTLQLRLHLRYTNLSNQKLILYRGDDLFYQAKIRPRTVEAGAKPYEVVVLNARYLEQENELIEQPQPGKLFIILQPGASYETDTMVGVGVVSKNATRDRNAIIEGEHTLQLLVSTWYRSRRTAEKLRADWQRKGILWFDPVLSNAITFNAERPQSLQPCQ